MNSGACVLTTINPPGAAVAAWGTRFPGGLIVIGDRKTPLGWHHEDADYYAVDRQERLHFASAGHLPTNHYARKNIGYLLAMARRATFIYDTDDDNAPTSTWTPREEVCLAEIVKAQGWCNVYHLFGADRIWPRGFSLRHLRQDAPFVVRNTMRRRSPVQQGLAAGSPDVDAIWRLTRGADAPLFTSTRSVALAEDVWCPFNSQTTWWFPKAYPLLYLPTHAPFRMTDIWRSFVAQRCLWSAGFYVTHHAPAEVIQDRNPHDLLRDFVDEIPGYRHNEAIVDALRALNLRSADGAADVVANLRLCYEALVRGCFLPPAELTAVDAWCKDVNELLEGDPC